VASSHLGRDSDAIGKEIIRSRVAARAAISSSRSGVLKTCYDPRSP
jgi:hypothetical protein